MVQKEVLQSVKNGASDGKFQRKVSTGNSTTYNVVELATHRQLYT